MRTTTTLLSLALLSACAAPLPQGEPATPQRPTFSSDTRTTVAGTVEVEGGIALDPNDALDVPVVVKLGLAEPTELAVGWAPYRYLRRAGDDGQGPGDLYVGVRHRFVDGGDEGPSAAFALTGKLPTASRNEGLGTGEVDLFGAAIVDMQAGPVALTGYYRLGVLSQPGRDDTDLQHGLAVAGGLPVDERLGVFGELTALLLPDQDLEALFLTGGATYALNPSLVLDAAVLVGLSKDAPDFQVFVGATQNFGRVTAP